MQDPASKLPRIPLLRLYEKWLEKPCWWLFGSTKHQNRALCGRFLRLVGYRFDACPEFSYSLSRHLGE
jgi:hypothetical protein